MRSIRNGATKQTRVRAAVTQHTLSPLLPSMLSAASMPAFGVSTRFFSTLQDFSPRANFTLHFELQPCMHAGYDSWLETFRCLGHSCHDRMNRPPPVVVTSYTREEAEDDFDK